MRKLLEYLLLKHQLSLRFFDEIPTNVSVQKSVDYICEHYAEEYIDE